MFCGDLFTQGGSEHEPLSDNILETSEQMRLAMDYFAHGSNTRSGESEIRLHELVPQHAGRG